MPVYLQFCGDCGRPALTLNEDGEARSAEHAAVFIPADETRWARAETGEAR